jgi:hypothetical protein
MKEANSSRGHSADMMRDFAKQFVWTGAMVKGLIAGIADNKNGEQANSIFVGGDGTHPAASPLFSAGRSGFMRKSRWKRV